MKSIMMTYPGFNNLSKGIKQLLMTSEEVFFDVAKPEMVLTASGHRIDQQLWTTHGRLIDGIRPTESNGVIQGL